jgi:DNA-binding response OmpR family regulator
MNENRSKILVVDDDLRLRQLLERYLSDQGFAVKAVRTVPQAWTARWRGNSTTSSCST